jgi:hypothetical protein
MLESKPAFGETLRRKQTSSAERECHSRSERSEAAMSERSSLRTSDPTFNVMLVLAINTALFRVSDVNAAESNK